MYSLRTSLIILGMILTGAARSVGVKVLYQLGFDHPLVVALFYLMGQSLALVVYWVSKYFTVAVDNKEPDYVPVPVLAKEEDVEDNQIVMIAVDGGNDEGSLTATSDDDSSDSEELSQMERQDEEEVHEEPLKDAPSSPTSKGRPSLQHHRQGSKTGLTQDSHDAVAWVHCIPWQLKPMIPGLFNLANAALKWASFVFVAASIAEMLMSGLELVLSVIVARLVRKRLVSKWRWMGVIIVAIGLWTVHAADVLDSNKNAATNTDEQNSQLQHDHSVGALLIVGQCITAVGQDMAEELFLQESEFPATLLLGMEGLFGLLFGIPLYLHYAPEPPMETLQGLQQSPWKAAYLIFLTALFTVTGIFNIMMTGATSSMTRNMWKNCRTLLVWILGLTLFYAVGDDELGEEWIVPDSFFILGGFLIMLSGIYVYYRHK